MILKHPGGSESYDETGKKAVCEFMGVNVFFNPGLE